MSLAIRRKIIARHLEALASLGYICLSNWGRLVHLYHALHYRQDRSLETSEGKNYSKITIRCSCKKYLISYHIIL